MDKPILWITDPWSTLDHPHETSLRLMQEAFVMGISQFWSDIRSLQWNETQVTLKCFPVLAIHPERTRESFLWGNPVICTVDAFDQIHFRVDPPVDLSYLHPLKLLKIASQANFVNSLDVLLECNEKLEALLLPECSPRTIVSSNWEDLKRFGEKYKKTVLKPLHTASSQGIDLLDWHAEEPFLKLQKASAQFCEPVLLQEFLPAIASGELRLWFVDGNLLAWIQKFPLPGDYRVNIDQGSLIQVCELRSFEKKQIPIIARHLQARKIRLAAIDLIDGKITDFNFTSPGLLVQMEACLQENLAKKILSSLAS
jgi:glutathione synthase